MFTLDFDPITAELFLKRIPVIEIFASGEDLNISGKFLLNNGQMSVGEQMTVEANSSFILIGDAYLEIS